MNKKIVMPLAVVIVLLIAGIGYLAFSLVEQKEANKEMQELADLDKKEMENEYEQFARQYSEMMTQINNDSIVEQLTQEQMRTQQLLEELKNVKSDNAREIARLKKELATVRAVLRNYVLEIDSLNRVNQTLTDENERMRGEYAAATRQIEGLSSEKASLSEKVAIAAQLDATNLRMSIRKKNGKEVKKIKDCRNLEVAFTIARNVTASNGMKTFYVRITTPTGKVMGAAGTFAYEDRNLEFSMKKSMEYTGNELQISTYLDVNETLMAGNYMVSVFADGNMIGSRTFAFK